MILEVISRADAGVMVKVTVYFKVISPAVLINPIHTLMPQPWGQSGVKCLAQGHFSMWRAGPGIELEP